MNAGTPPLALIKELQAFVDRNIRRWDKRYPGIISGYHVARKKIRGKASPAYSIVFHVAEKIPASELPPEQRLPKVVHLKTRKGRLAVPTDIIAAGKGTLLAGDAGDALMPGDAVQELGRKDYGTIGPVVHRDGEYYILTNMHVIGASHLDAGFRTKIVEKPDQSLDVVAKAWKRPVACFARGVFGPYLDAALARIDDASDLQPWVPGAGIPVGSKKIEKADYEPKGYRISMAGNRTRASGKIVNSRAVKTFETPWGDIRLSNLLQISPAIACPGDSGSALTDVRKNVLGMVFGSDDLHSYAIPIQDILSEFDVKLHVNAD